MNRKICNLSIYLTNIRYLNISIILQDSSGEIENEELSGFLKDLLELVKNVSIAANVEMI